jgi:hypothetical protein
VVVMLVTVVVVPVIVVVALVTVVVVPGTVQRLCQDDSGWRHVNALSQAKYLAFLAEFPPRGGSHYQRFTRATSETTHT